MMMLMHMMWFLCICFLQVMVKMNMMISQQMMPCCQLSTNITLHCFSDVIVYKYHTSLLLWWNITVISSALVVISEISLVESYTLHLPTIYSIIFWSFQTPYCMFFGVGGMSASWSFYMTCHKGFHTFAIVFRTLKNLLLGILGAVGTWKNHFLSWNMFWEDAVEYLRKI